MNSHIGTVQMGGKSVKSDPSLSWDGILSQVQFLQGKVLTVVDAVFPPGRQNKSTKDLINNAFFEQLEHISSLCHGKYMGPTTCGSSEREENKPVE